MYVIAQEGMTIECMYFHIATAFLLGRCQLYEIVEHYFMVCCRLVPFGVL